MNDSIGQKIKGVFYDLKPGHNIPEDQLVESGFIDSFDIIVLVDGLENAFGIAIPGTDITPENFNSIDSLSSLINQLMKSE
jgi:acyl carrier protein